LIDIGITLLFLFFPPILADKEREEKPMYIYEKLSRKATKLVNRLQDDVTSGKTLICENYGQKEIRRFLDREISPLKSGILTYQEKCDIKDILYKVSSIS